MFEKGKGNDNIYVGAGLGLSEHAKWQPKWTIEKYNADMKLYDIEQIEGNLLLDEGISSLLTLLIGGSETPFNNENAYIGVGDGNPTNLTGTVTFNNGTTDVTGDGTTFLSQVAVGDLIGLSTDGAVAVVNAINSDTSITLKSSYSGESGSGTAVKILGAQPTQTGLQATTNKTYAPMDATFPQIFGNTVTFRATFGPTSGNHAWKEFTVSNGNSDSAKNLNRKVEAPQRVKVEPDTWVIQLQITIS